jgi:predicted GNAT superfamily acetyltransferase
MVTIELSESQADLEGIIALQRINHTKSLSEAQRLAQGFVTMEYTVDQLRLMAGQYRHVVAKVDGVVAGYALVMLEQHRAPFTFLLPMFDTIEASRFNGKAIRDCRWFVMGQVCIAAPARGQGVFDRMYAAMREQMQGDFDLIATEVSEQNGPSLGAHARVGFRTIESSDPSPEWRVIAWDWT